ncbi:VCBS domain-containing protein [Bradyrhizobium sp. CCBAU 53338]|uniref:VCBS domain-containing protein n=1 Tax=Bradyrhizobium sp. CCBAU 53338 TaxID=1325111 RepID=UPI00273A4C97|nr:VCBS domain-containing protein [Bradyrhizobium sp. CCBAU 53338]
MFADGDTTDIPTATVLSESAVYKDAAGQTLNLDPAKLAVLENALTETVRPGNSNVGGAYWSYDVADKDLDFLGQGETVTVTATIRLDDGHGHQVDTPVTVTINGTNDLPTVGPVASQQATPADGPITIDLLSTATDPDHGDVIALAGAPTVTSSDGHVVTFSTSGSIITIDPSQFAYLQSGQGVDLSIGFDVGDGPGATHATASVAIAKPGPGDIHLADWTGARTEQAVFTDIFGTMDHSWQPLGNVTATDGAHSGSLSYSLTGPSASDFTLMGTGLYLTGQAHLDYDAWHTAVENAFGGGLTDAQIDAKLGTGIVSDPVAAAALATAFAGTPYMAQITATDAFGNTSAQNVFVDLHDVGRDLQNALVTLDSSLSELTPVGTVVGHVDGLLPNDPYKPYFQADPNGYFSFDGNNLVVARPLDFAAQSHFDIQLETPVAPTADTPFWQYSSSSLPINVQDAHLLSGDPSSFNFTQTASEATEGAPQETLIGSLSLPTAGTTTLALDDSYPWHPSHMFDVRTNGDGTASLYLEAGAWVNRNALGASGLLNLSVGAYTTNDGAVTKSVIPVSLHMHEARYDPSQPNLNGVVWSSPHSTAPAAVVAFVNPDYYDVSYSVSLGSSADDQAFTLSDAQTDQWGQVTAALRPAVALQDRPYTVDVHVVGSNGYDHVSQLTFAPQMSPPIEASPIDDGQVSTSNSPVVIDLLQNAFGSGPLSIAPASLHISTTDGQPVGYTLDHGVINIDPSLFAAAVGPDRLWKSASNDVGLEHVSISYGITDGANTVTNEAHFDVDSAGPGALGGALFNSASADYSSPSTGAVTVGSWYNEQITGAAFFRVFHPTAEGLSFSESAHVVAAYNADGSPLVLTDAQQAALTGGASIYASLPSMGFADWMYNVDDAADGFLLRDQKAILEVDITANDGEGHTAVQPFTVIVNGLDHAPQLNGVSDAIAADAGPVSGVSYLSDRDAGDLHTLSATYMPAWSSSPVGQVGNLSLTLLSEPNPTDSNPYAPGSFRWDYTPDPVKAAALSQGETATDYFYTQVADNHGGSSGSGAVFTVTGVNSAPTVMAPAQTVNVSVDANHGPGASESYGDNFQFADANWHDTHAVSATLLSTDFGDHALGTIGANIRTDATNGAAGTVGWSYAVDDAALTSLAPDQVVHEVFDFAIADNHGGVAHHQVNINLSHYPMMA